MKHPETFLVKIKMQFRVSSYFIFIFKFTWNRDNVAWKNVSYTSVKNNALFIAEADFDEDGLFSLFIFGYFADCFLNIISLFKPLISNKAYSTVCRQLF